MIGDNENDYSAARAAGTDRDAHALSLPARAARNSRPRRVAGSLLRQ